MSIVNITDDNFFELIHAIRYADKTCLRYCDDLLSTTFNPWAGSAIASGTTASIAAYGKHPGIIALKSSTTANSGWLVMTNMTNAHIPFNGRMRTTFIIRPVTLTGSTIRAGFHNGTAGTRPVAGVWFQITAGVLEGYWATDPTTFDVTGSNYTLTANTWYRIVIDIDTNAQKITFRCYQDDSNTLLWKDSFTKDMSAAVVKHGIIATNSGTTAVEICHVDLLEFMLYNTRKVF